MDAGTLIKHFMDFVTNSIIEYMFDLGYDLSFDLGSPAQLSVFGAIVKT